jgi:hypothetical protein
MAHAADRRCARIVVEPVTCSVLRSPQPTEPWCWFNQATPQLGDRAGYRVTINPAAWSVSNKPSKPVPTGTPNFNYRTVVPLKSPQLRVTFRKTGTAACQRLDGQGRHIQHLPGIPNPNNVTTPTALISVRGTIFDVDVQDRRHDLITLDNWMRHLRGSGLLLRQNPFRFPGTPGPLHDWGFVLHQADLEDAVSGRRSTNSPAIPALVAALQFSCPAAVRQVTRARIKATPPGRVPVPRPPEPPLHRHLLQTRRTRSFVPVAARKIAARPFYESLVLPA